MVLRGPRRDGRWPLLASLLILHHAHLATARSAGPLCSAIDSYGLDRANDGVVTTGTTLIAAKYKDGVVIGADSRTVKGNRYVLDRFTDKVVRVSNHVCVASSGRTAVVQRLSEELTNRLRFYKITHQRCEAYLVVVRKSVREPTSKNAAALLRLMLRRGSGNGMSPGTDTDAIAAGWSAREGPSIHQVLAGGSVLEPGDFAVSGTGATYIIGYMDAYYPHARDTSSTLSKDECLTMVKRALALAIGRDTMSGGSVTLCCIDDKGVEKLALSAHELMDVAAPPPMQDSETRMPSGE